MTVVGVAMVRDEADIIGTVLRHMASQVDAIVIADNRSTDGTAGILDDATRTLDVPVVVLSDPDVGYEQSQKMTALARQARAWFGAEWIVPFDADEIWYSPSRRLGNYLASRAPTDMIVEATLYDHVATGRDHPDETDPTLRIQWRRPTPAPLPKVAARWRDNLVIGMGNHDVTYGGLAPQAPFQRLAIRHFPYRSPEQTVRKIRNGAEAYAATDLPDYYGAHWRQWGKILEEKGEGAIVDLFHKWHVSEDPTRESVVDGETIAPLTFSPARDVMTIW